MPDPWFDFPAWRAWCYLGGVLAFCIALLSPVAADSEVLFSMRMVQHLLLTPVPPLAVGIARRAADNRRARILSDHNS
ncbi:MAG: cytochrome c oxidase assembly protein [Chloroflexia bacterium]|nr:cytochrome c oxidase assembly protein [Chloroflexia bacterium]